MEAVYVFFTIMFWRASDEAFENDAENAGWFLIFLSAFNCALLMNKLL
jgi:hypothetical protein